MKRPLTKCPLTKTSQRQNVHKNQETHLKCPLIKRPCKTTSNSIQFNLRKSTFTLNVPCHAYNLFLF